MRSQVNDWDSYVGRIELAMALEHRFNCSITDEELDAADTANAYVSLICRKVGGLADNDVLREVCEAMLGIRPELTKPAILVQSFRELLSTYRRADA